jgi:hypothetical protein
MAAERIVTLDVDELSETLRVLREAGHGKAGGDYEPECPVCSAADKLDATLGPAGVLGTLNEQPEDQK